MTVELEIEEVEVEPAPEQVWRGRHPATAMEAVRVISVEPGGGTVIMERLESRYPDVVLRRPMRCPTMNLKTVFRYERDTTEADLG